MIRTLDFNAFAAGTLVETAYAETDGVTISALGGSGRAMIFDSANATPGASDLASDRLGGLLIISADGNSDTPLDAATGGTLRFDFASPVRLKNLTFKDIEEQGTASETRMLFYAADGNLIADHFVKPTADGGEVDISLNVPGVARLEVVLPGSGAVDNLVFDDGAVDRPSLDGLVEGTPGPDVIDLDYRGDPEGDRVDAGDAVLPGQSGDDDIILAGAGADSVRSGAGDDLVDGDSGDDTLFGEAGRDTVIGREGDDVIDTSGPDWAPDSGYPASDEDPLFYAPDEDPEDDRDWALGGDGNDTIRTGDDRDTISGGAGADVIDAGLDNDHVRGGTGSDFIVGGEGSDTIEAGDGNDTVFAGNDPSGQADSVNLPDERVPSHPFSPDRNPGNGRDFVDAGAGDDLVYGADDDDTLLGGSGDDTILGEIDDDLLIGGAGRDNLLGGQGDDLLDGGADADWLSGGDGDDTLLGRGGADTLLGDAGRDVFQDVGAGDQIDGGSGPIDFDTLDLRGATSDGGRLAVTFTSEDQEDGVVDFFDAEGQATGQLTFEEIERVIPCFTPGTRIATPKGEVLVEDLKPGDRVITRDNGFQTVCWAGTRQLGGMKLDPHLVPIRIRRGALGNDVPARDMLVSPNHRMLIANAKTALYLDESEVLVAAKHLLERDGVDLCPVPQVTYVHFMCAQHEVVLSDEAWTESFQPGASTLQGLKSAQRSEIFEIFPELATEAGVAAYSAARRDAKKHEGLLVAS